MNEIVVTQPNFESTIEVMRGDSNSRFWSTLPMESFDERLEILNSLTQAQPLNEHLGEVIPLRGYIAQVVTVQTEDGAREAIQTILISADGNAFTATSEGVVNALQTIRSLLGDPNDWPSPINVYASEERSRNNAAWRYITLRVVK